MNLTTLLSNLPPVPELQQLALVFSSEVNDALILAQSFLSFTGNIAEYTNKH